MRIEQFKIMATARALGKFTIREVADHAGVSIHTVKSFARRGEDLFVPTGEVRTQHGAGKPATVYRIAPERMPEIDALIDGQDAEEDVDPAEAVAAMREDHARWRCRETLFSTRDTLPGERRSHLLAQARNWFDHEEERIRYWKAYASPPVDVVEEIADIGARLRAIELGVDLLDIELTRFTLPKATSEWLVEGISAWVSSRGQPGTNPFAPLQISARTVNTLVDDLAFVFGHSTKVSSVATDRLVIAALIAMPTLPANEVQLTGGGERVSAATIGCELLLKLGGETLARALADILADREADHPTTRWLILRTLGALQAQSKLLEYEGFGPLSNWFMRLQGSHLWHDDYKEIWAVVRSSMPEAENELTIRQLGITSDDVDGPRAEQLIATHSFLSRSFRYFRNLISGTPQHVGAGAFAQ